MKNQTDVYLRSSNDEQQATIDIISTYTTETSLHGIKHVFKIQLSILQR